MLPVEFYRGEEALRNDREVQRNLEAGIYRGGVLSRKHETGVAWFPDRIARALEIPLPPRLAAVS